jgi:DNA invertase Pin-like site-specific DNA recombinase
MPTTASAPQRIAIYARISEDEQDLGEGVIRQLEDGRVLAAQRGWSVVAELSDNDISATNGKHRPGYQRLMQQAKAGEFDRIVTYHTSRMWRNRQERAHGIELLGKAQVSLTTVKGPELDLSSAAGRGMAELLGAFDTMESEIKGERVTRAALQRAENGAPNGAIPFGWKRIYDYDTKGKPIPSTAHDVHHEDEAPIVKEVCERLLSGKTVVEVTVWLNTTDVPAPGADFKLRHRDRGMQNPTGARWGKSSVKKLALRPANAGLRKYHSGREDERLLPARIEPIITRDQWERLVARFEQNKKLRPDGDATVLRPGARVHLLTWGIGKCGVCGSVLRVGRQGQKDHKKQLYQCEQNGCTGRNEASVDTWVTANLVGVLSREDVMDSLFDNEAADAAYARAETQQRKLDGITDDYDNDLITREQFLRLTAECRTKIATALSEAQNAAPLVPVELIRHVHEAADPGLVFADLPVAQKRILVEAFISEVRIMPTRRGPGFEPNDVKIQWRRAH